MGAFIERARRLPGEKADADTGWVYPIPDETCVHGHDDDDGHIVECFRAGPSPRETFADGYVVNAILDAAIARCRAAAGSRSSRSRCG